MNIFQVTAVISCSFICSLTANVSYLSADENLVQSPETYRSADELTPKYESIYDEEQSSSNTDIDTDNLVSSVKNALAVAAPHALPINNSDAVAANLLSSSNNNISVASHKQFSYSTQNVSDIVSDQWIMDGAF